MYPKWINYCVDFFFRESSGFKNFAWTEFREMAGFSVLNFAISKNLNYAYRIAKKQKFYFVVNFSYKIDRIFAQMVFILGYSNPIMKLYFCAGVQKFMTFKLSFDKTKR